MQVFFQNSAKIPSFCGKSTMSMFLATIIGGTIFSLASFYGWDSAISSYLFLSCFSMSITPDIIRLLKICMAKLTILTLFFFAWDSWDFETFASNRLIYSLLQSLTKVSKSQLSHVNFCMAILTFLAISPISPLSPVHFSFFFRSSRLPFSL